MKPIKTSYCELCNRDIFLTFHHLVPKKYHNNRSILESYDKNELIHHGIWVCSDCHKQIHRLISLKDLAFEYNTLANLKNHDDLSRFVAWAAKQTKNIKR